MGFHYFAQCSEGEVISEYHLQAAIASVHANATNPKGTDWKMILELYDQLMALNPSPLLRLIAWWLCRRFVGQRRGWMRCSLCCVRHL
jgi:predicted RNA polymerase sigma factor